MITRHHTLPAGLPTQNSSMPNSEPSVHTGSSHSDPNLAATGTEESTLDQITMPLEHNFCNMTTSMTMSSMTSFITGTPPQRSPMCADASRPIFSPPVSPRPLYPPQSITTISGSAQPQMPDIAPRGQSAQISPLHLPYAHQYQYANPQTQMTFLTPYCASTNLPPPVSPNLAITRADNLSCSSLSPLQVHASPSQLLNPQQIVHPGFAPNIQPSVSPGSVTFDASSELLHEITRLRERLTTLETENAAMSHKLNSQQWDVENRLKDIEMHICQSDSLASTETAEDKIERLDAIARESII